MRTVSISAARTHLSSLMRAVEAGEKLIITRRGKPVAELTAVKSEIDPDDRYGLKWLAERRARMTPMSDDSADLIRQMRDEGDH